MLYPLRRLTIVLIGTFCLVSSSVEASAHQLEISGPLAHAFQAVLDYEAVLNARDYDGQYRVQNEPAEQLAERLKPLLTDDFIGVTGLGSATEVYGYQPTAMGRLQYAHSLKAFQALGSYADLLNGGAGSYDFLHVPFSGEVSGNVAYFTFNFIGLGSLTNEAGERQPVVIPNSLVDPSAEGALPVIGRCICVCVRVKGKWKLASFYFVLTPEELVFGAS